jgi:hypothetical protein
MRRAQGGRKRHVCYRRELAILYKSKNNSKILPVCELIHSTELNAPRARLNSAHDQARKNRGAPENDCRSRLHCCRGRDRAPPCGQASSGTRSDWNDCAALRPASDHGFAQVAQTTHNTRPALSSARRETTLRAWHDRTDERNLTINCAKCSDNSSDRVRWAFRNLVTQ